MRDVQQAGVGKLWQILGTFACARYQVIPNANVAFYGRFQGRGISASGVFEPPGIDRKVP